MDDTICRDKKLVSSPSKKKKVIVLICLIALVLILFFFGLTAGSSSLSFTESVQALFGQGDEVAIRIVTKIRLPRVLAALIAGAGLAVAGLMMQTTLGNSMASPATLGVSNAAVFGANISIILFAGGFLSTGNNVKNYMEGANPFATSSIAFVFALISTLLILVLAQIRKFSPGVLVLCGIAMGSVWTAATSLLQFHATDVGLSAAVVWTFGDLGRATFTTDFIMLGVVLACSLFFLLFSYRFNALSSGEDFASSVGVRVPLLRFVTLLLASMITAVAVSYLGMIGFVGIICPHVMRRIIGNDHRFLIPASFLSGSVLLLFSDIVSRLAGGGSAIPIGAVTALLGAPFFLALILFRKGERV